MLYIFFCKRGSLRSALVFTFVFPISSIASPVLGIISLVNPSITPLYLLVDLFSIVNWIVSIMSLENIGHAMPNFIFANIIFKVIAACLASFYIGHLVLPTLDQKIEAFQRTKDRLDSVSRGSMFNTYANTVISTSSANEKNNSSLA
jgi:hypothetical protein